MDNTIVKFHKKSDADYIDLRLLLKSVYENKGLILFISLMIAIFAITYSLFKANKYQTSLLLKIEHKQFNVIGAAANANQASGLAKLNSDPIAVQIALLQSEYVLGPVIRALELAKTSPEADVINQMRRNLTITDLSNSPENQENSVAILRITLTGTEPNLIRKTLNQIAIVMQQKNIERKIAEAEKSLAYLNRQLPIIQNSLQTAEAELNHYRSTSGRIDIKLQTQYLLSHLSEIDKELEQVRLKHSHMLEQYTVKHPFVISINQQIKELARKRQQLVTQLRHLPASDQQAVNLTRDINVKSNLYMLLLNQIHQMQVIKTGVMSDIQVLSQATTPVLLKRTKLSLLALISLMIGMVLSSVFIMGWKLFLRKINDPFWIERNWHINTLAIVPYCPKFKNDKYTLPLHDKAYTALTSVRSFLQIQHKKNNSQIISLLSPTYGAGKNFIASQLAISLARVGNRVLIIDADVEKGTLHQHFSCEVSPGLTEILNEQHALDSCMLAIAGMPNLSILPRGHTFSHATDLLHRPACKTLLAELSEQFDYVIINTKPSLFPTDNAQIANLSHYNLLVLGANQHEAIEIDSMLKQLSHVGVKFHGCIFNHPTKTGRLIPIKTLPATVRRVFTVAHSKV